MSTNALTYIEIDNLVMNDTTCITSVDYQYDDRLYNSLTIAACDKNILDLCNFEVKVQLNYVI